MTSKFDEIRPYNNEDLPHVLNALLSEEAFIESLVALKFPKSPAFTKPLLKYLCLRVVTKKIANINKLKDFQLLIEPYMERMIKDTISSLSVSGLDTLDLTEPCLFISNHRDIALDPALVNWVLHMNKQDTVRIAVGDNLLTKDWVADIIRLNKCFVVKRDVKGRREKLEAAKLLSEYIHYSLITEQQHLWIAQREGRAKDGIDVTNSALLSMLSLHKPKAESFGDYVGQLRIVPVSISYEFDPCDLRKAKEVYQAEQEGAYKKHSNEDLLSIVDGIKGRKGKVHLHFGKLAGNNFSDTKDLAQYIDAQILAGYKTFSTAKAALSLLNNEKAVSVTDPNFQSALKYLQNKLNNLNDGEGQKLLTMYANPLLRQQKIANSE